MSNRNASFASDVKRSPGFAEEGTRWVKSKKYNSYLLMLASWLIEVLTSWRVLLTAPRKGNRSSQTATRTKVWSSSSVAKRTKRWKVPVPATTQASMTIVLSSNESSSPRPTRHLAVWSRDSKMLTPKISICREWGVLEPIIMISFPLRNIHLGNQSDSTRKRNGSSTSDQML